MAIDRDEGDGRQARLDGMIREFQDARARRLVIDAGRPAVAAAAAAKVTAAEPPAADRAVECGVLCQAAGASRLIVQDDREQ